MERIKLQRDSENNVKQVMEVKVIPLQGPLVSQESMVDGLV